MSDKVYSDDKPIFDNVNRPAHYCEGRKYEPINVIVDWGLDFDLGNALKYISRAGRKDDAVADLKKAIFYIEHEIMLIEGGIDNNEEHKNV